MMSSKSSKRNIVILGNGKSLELYDSQSHKDALVIGCNVPPENTKIDFVCAVDAYAISHAYRINMPFHHRLKEGWKLVLGPRACNGLLGTKDIPGGSSTLFDHLKKEGHFYKKFDLIDAVKDVGQRYFSSGHLAFLFACSDYPGAEIDIYGFDSLFTGSIRSKTKSLIRDGKTEYKRSSPGSSQETPDPTAKEWLWLWDKMFNSDLNTSEKIRAHGYEHDPTLEIISPSLEVVRHKKQNEKL